MFIFKINYNNQWYVVGAENIEEAEDRFFDFMGFSEPENIKITIEQVDDNVDLSKDESIEIF